MKKWIFCFIILFSIFYFNIPSKEIVRSVFAGQEEYSLYTLTFKNQNVSTNNFNNYFQNKNVVWIEPYISNLYSREMNSYKVYKFDYLSTQGNINRFLASFIKKLEQNNFKSQALKIRIDGLLLQRAMIYSNDEEIEEIKNKIENLEIEKNY